MVKMALDGLVSLGSVAVRKVGQKFLYTHKSLFVANDVAVFK
jgi:hypothetical protein